VTFDQEDNKEKHQATTRETMGWFNENKSLDRVVGRSKSRNKTKQPASETKDEVNKAFTEVSASVVKRNMDENQYMFSYPELVDGMSDHIKAHRRGKQFSYATLVEGEPESNENLLSRLRTFKPSGGKTTTTADKMPHISLTGPYHCLKLSRATDFLSTKKTSFKYSKEFILVSEILITYVPLISFGDKFSAFKVAIIDNRKVDDTIVRSYTGNTNISCNASMSLDYCTSLSDIEDMELAFVCPQPTLKAGKVWAVINVHLVLQQFDFPVQTYVKPTFSIFQIPHSGLNDHDTDPRHFNGMIQEADLEAMKQIKSDGDISDISKPHVKTMAKSALAGTAFAGKSAIKPRMGLMREVKDTESIDSGYLPAEDGNDEDTPVAIKRLQESALKAQRAAAGLDENSPPSKMESAQQPGSNGSASSVGKPKMPSTYMKHNRTFSGSTIADEEASDHSKGKSKVRFQNLNGSIERLDNKGDEELSYWE
jgi:hypothetical protein